MCIVVVTAYYYVIWFSLSLSLSLYFVIDRTKICIDWIQWILLWKNIHKKTRMYPIPYLPIHSKFVRNKTKKILLESLHQSNKRTYKREHHHHDHHHHHHRQKREKYKKLFETSSKGKIKKNKTTSIITITTMNKTSTK